MNEREFLKVGETIDDFVLYSSVLDLSRGFDVKRYVCHFDAAVIGSDSVEKFPF